MSAIYQAIVTKYLPPTNIRGPRIKASSAARSIIVNYDHSLNIEAMHSFAASKLAERMGWDGQWHGGGLPDNRGYCFVLVEAGDPAFIVAKAK